MSVQAENVYSAYQTAFQKDKKLGSPKDWSPWRLQLKGKTREGKSLLVTAGPHEHKVVPAGKKMLA